MYYKSEIFTIILGYCSIIIVVAFVIIITSINVIIIM